MDNVNNRIFCAHCGSENHSGATYCKHCGKPLIKPEITEEIAVIPKETEAEVITEPQIVSSDKISVCPFCHSEDCRPVNKTNVKSHGGGFGFFNALIGFILMGPAGLLCGACGHTSVHTTVSNETWWVCPSCGKEFISKDAAITKAKNAMERNAVIGTLVIIFLALCIDQGCGLWLKAFIILGFIVLWALIPSEVEDNSGYKISQILIDDAKRREFWKEYVAIIIANLLLGFAIAESILTM